MKTSKKTLFICLIMLATKSFSQETAIDSTGLPGDNFSLQGALDLFKSSNSLEDFEKKINDEKNGVNNLDLNEDGKVDYVRVIDNMKNDVHAIVLQVPVSETESQDVAVVELEKNGNESAIVQIVGDEELYGDKIIIEPIEEKEVLEQKKGEKGPYSPSVNKVGVVVNVWFWPCVRFVYAPTYVLWVSPWRWNVYPVWYRPWLVRPWRWHYNHCRAFRPFYHPVAVHRVVVAHAIYKPHRRTSAVVVARHRNAHVIYRAKRANQNQSIAPARTRNQKAIQKAPRGGAKKQGGKGRRK